jgi:hypothetical protein
VLTALIGLAALVAGVTGAWSPCGFSVVDTLGRGRDLGGRRLVAASCAAFTVGAIAGGIATFATLSAIGSALSSGGRDAAVMSAVVIAALAAIGETRGVRIVPQIRRQVPEPWRRTMPLPLASGLYGVLLGLGFMTFVLTLAFWSLGVAVLALGEPAAGVVAGIAFGLGRALPVAAMAPRYRTGGGELQTLMCEKPLLLRRLRLADGAMLVAVAVALALHSTGDVIAAKAFANSAADPSAAGGDLAWRVPGGGGVFVRGGSNVAIGGDDLAIGGRYIAVRNGAVTTVYDRAAVGARGTNTGVAPSFPAVSTPNATGVAISDDWLIWRVSAPGTTELIQGVPIANPSALTTLATARVGEQLSRPSTEDDRLVFARNSKHLSEIEFREISTGVRRTLVRTRTISQVREPSISADRVIYVAAHPCWQRLVSTTVVAPKIHETVWRTGGTARRDEGHENHRTSHGSSATNCPRPRQKRTSSVLGSTASDATYAYVTLMQPTATGPAAARLVRTPLNP